jgi:hypothetical protein
VLCPIPVHWSFHHIITCYCKNPPGHHYVVSPRQSKRSRDHLDLQEEGRCFARQKRVLSLDLIPQLCPNPNPASLSSFSLFCSFYDYPLATITISHYLISNYCFPPSSPWIAQPISLSLLTPLTPHFHFFIILWTRSIIMV